MQLENLKSKLHESCTSFLNKRYQSIENSITQISESLNSATKSSAGDKHETTRAMLQLEREKLGNQLAEVVKLQKVLQKVTVSKASERISLGSLVFTSSQNYFIAIGAGLIHVDGTDFYAISPATPIAKALIGLKEGDYFTFRNANFVITVVL